MFKALRIRRLRNQMDRRNGIYLAYCRGGFWSASVAYALRKRWQAAEAAYITALVD